MSAAPVHAEPTYPGNACLANEGNITSVQRGFGDAGNNSVTRVRFHCPVTQHRVGGPRRFITGATAQVVDRTTSDEVECLLISHSKAGSVTSFARAGSGIAFANDVAEELAFGRIELNRSGFIAFVCDVPGRTPAGELSGVVTYSIPESF